MAGKWLAEIITERIKARKPKDKDNCRNYTEAQCTTYKPRKDSRGGVKKGNKDTESICTAFGSSNEILRDRARGCKETSCCNTMQDCIQRNKPNSYFAYIPPKSGLIYVAWWRCSVTETWPICNLFLSIKKKKERYWKMINKQQRPKWWRMWRADINSQEMLAILVF